ncbi:hypothetical protein ACNI3T_05390 [Christiangramia sp. ASW11-125]|uniref:hypothetical protein n=1 Tax=Christiangramia sp. ASW11-125 TaxID=3400701 RepID=UPI003AAC3EE0
MAFVSLPDKLYYYLKDELKSRPDLSMDLAVLILSFIINPFKNMNKGKDYVNLCSTALRKFNYRSYRYQDHLEYLQQLGILIMSEYSNRQDGKGKCRGFKISEKYITKY